MGQNKASIEFAKIIIGLAANFGVKIQDGLIEFWYDAFKEDGINIEQIRYAAGKILRKPKNRYGHLPTYDEFIEIIQGGSNEDRAIIIANEIIVHTKTYGSKVFPNINDDKIAKHLMTKRWPYHEWAASILESELKWWVKEFCEVYRSYALTAQTQKYLEFDNLNNDLKKLVSQLPPIKHAGL